MSGLYKIRLNWDRISKELDLGRPKKDIHKDLKQEGLYPYGYESFLKTIKKELNTHAQPTTQTAPEGEAVTTLETGDSPPLSTESKKTNIFTKRDVGKDVAEVKEAADKFLTK